ncbi:serine hydrolase domain-containing protein [Saccharopolyspora gregorii]|uniref:serine hydrolase domain-containing protein n=1 Tax=Saccharopolyspora gregorii TaxID=33914 RepID=UPI0021AB9DBF|nr:serine hydrolase domain-containing protein [Saccharopolyspora gregorii]
MKRTLATLMIVTAVQTAVFAGTAGATPVRDTMQHDADVLLSHGAPGVLAELQTPDGSTKVRSGFGDTEARTPVPWDANFRIGSFTKTYVSATLLQLVGEGRISLEDPVEKWLPGVVSGNGNDGSRITVRQLLQHTSGLPEFVLQLPWMFDEEGFQQHRDDTFAAEHLVSLAMQQPPKFEPGTSWSYSNTNFVLAGMIIQRVTGNEWQTEVQDRIIEPLGLHDTYTPRASKHIPGPHATGYQRFPDDMNSPNPTFGAPLDVTEINPTWAGAAGDIISSTADGNRFLRALIDGEVLRPAELAEMQRTVPATEMEANWPGLRYGLGLMWAPNDCGGYWSHGGDIPGYKTRNGVSPDGERSVVVSINTDSLVPEPGVPAPTTDPVSEIVENALCGDGR